MDTPSPGTQQQPQDWHPADIKAALAKAGGYTFARIAREHGYASNAPNSVLHKPWSHMEQIVADIIGVRPADIWPSRYDRRGQPLRSRSSWMRTKNNRIANRDVAGNV